MYQASAQPKSLPSIFCSSFLSQSGFDTTPWHSLSLPCARLWAHTEYRLALSPIPHNNSMTQGQKQRIWIQTEAGLTSLLAATLLLWFYEACTFSVSICQFTNLTNIHWTLTVFQVLKRSSGWRRETFTHKQLRIWVTTNNWNQKKTYETEETMSPVNRTLRSSGEWQSEQSRMSTQGWL